MRKILWFPWKDPAAPLIASRPFHDDDDDDHGGISTCAHNSPVGPCIVGPMGVIPLREDALASKLFNFWMGHTNFDLSSEVVNRIQLVAGVETLDIFTRYRFRLGIGKAFKEKEVRDAVELVCEETLPPTVSAKKLLESLQRK